MRTQFSLLSLAFFVLLTSSVGVNANAQGREDQIVRNSEATLDEIMRIPARGIPANLLAKAEGIAIIPGMVKGGFVVGIRHGRGVLVMRDANRAWQPPVFLTMTGGSVGFQAGLQTTDVVLVFKTRNSLANIMRGKLTIGADAAAAAGPVGRQASAATDARLQAEILSYSRSRGLFAGVSLDGSGISLDHASGFAYYRRPIFQPDGTMIDPTAPIPESAFNLISKVAGYTDPRPLIATKAYTAPMGVASTRRAPTETLPLGNPPGPGAVAPRTSTTISEAELQRSRLVGSWRRLQPMLDESWKSYLSLPVSVYLPNGKVDPKELDQTIERFSNLARDPRYDTLTRRPEFTETLKMMQDLAKPKASPGPAKLELKLPPPPAEKAGVGSTRGRY